MKRKVDNSKHRCYNCNNHEVETLDGEYNQNTEQLCSRSHILDKLRGEYRNVSSWGKSKNCPLWETRVRYCEEHGVYQKSLNHMECPGCMTDEQEEEL